MFLYFIECDSRHLIIYYLNQSISRWEGVEAPRWEEEEEREGEERKERKKQRLERKNDVKLC